MLIASTLTKFVEPGYVNYVLHDLFNRNKIMGQLEVSLEGLYRIRFSHKGMAQARKKCSVVVFPPYFRVLYYNIKWKLLCFGTEFLMTANVPHTV